MTDASLMSIIALIFAVSAISLIFAWMVRYSRARLAEATRYWQRSVLIWRMISSAPIEHLSDDQLEAFAKALEDADAAREGAK